MTLKSEYLHTREPWREPGPEKLHDISIYTVPLLARPKAGASSKMMIQTYILRVRMDIENDNVSFRLALVVCLSLTFSKLEKIIKTILNIHVKIIGKLDGRLHDVKTHVQLYR